MAKLILASTSIHRKKLLEQLGLDFAAHKPEVDERTLEGHFAGPIEKLAEHLAHKKAASLQSRFQDHPIVGSDQVLLFNNKTLPKPETRQEAIDRLSLLQGDTHELHTALCFIYQGEIKLSTTIARMTMFPLSKQEIATYVDKENPLGCAGGYKIESKGPLLFRRVDTSDYYSIIGLPIATLVALLRTHDLLPK